MESHENAYTIELSKDFAVPVEQLFQAWTEPDQLKEWWHPMGNDLENVVNELKAGGAVEYHITNAGIQIKGKYREADVNKKLVYTWNWEMEDSVGNADYVLTITFQSTENGSTLGVMQEGLPNAEAAKPHEEGWETGLESLKSYLEKSPGRSESSPAATGEENLKSDEGMSDRSGGYNEAPDQVKVGGG